MQDSTAPDSKPFPDRDKRIAEAAYYRAEKRGFAPGYALEDWLVAEALVDFEIARVEYSGAETARVRNGTALESHAAPPSASD
jgi:hypothetical protein